MTPSGRGAAAEAAGSGRAPPRLQHAAFDALYLALAVLLAPYALVRYLTQEKTRARWRAYARDLPERFHRRAPREGTRPCVWVHGVSVGEVKAVRQLVEAMAREWPDLETVVTVSTDTARRVARDLYADRRVDFYPPDLSWVVRDALDAVRPDLVVLVESEFWPNFLTAAAERAIPVVLVNGRMSERSRRRFGAVPSLARRLLGTLAEVCVQLETYAERFRAVGVAPDRIHVTGNMKLDNIPVRVEDPRREALRRLVRGAGDLPLVVAGSTHPGEERALDGMRRRLAASGRPFQLVIAPRHPARAEAIEGELRRAGTEVVRRSALAPDRTVPPGAVVLLDTVGELEAMYGVADAVFVGGTLVPHGGQNMMEPASLGRPVVVGPSLHNFRGEVEMLLQREALVVAPDAAGVEAALAGWLADPAAARAVGARALATVEAAKGATRETLAVLRPRLARLGSA